MSIIVPGTIPKNCEGHPDTVIYLHTLQPNQFCDLKRVRNLQCKWSKKSLLLIHPTKKTTSPQLKKKTTHNSLTLNFPVYQKTTSSFVSTDFHQPSPPPPPVGRWLWLPPRRHRNVAKLCFHSYQAKSLKGNRWLILLMAEIPNNQLRLVVYPIIYRVSAPSQLV